MKVYKFYIGIFSIGLLAFCFSPQNIQAQTRNGSKKSYHSTNKRYGYSNHHTSHRSSHSSNHNNHHYTHSYKHHKWHGPRYGSHASHVHRDAVIVRHGRYCYHYYDGVFYKPANGHYIISTPSIGFRIGFLPIGFKTIIVRERPYYYHGGVFYKKIYHNEYEVIRPPMGAVIEYLPENAREIYIEGREYYEFEGVYYKPVIIDGYLMYEVSGYN